MRTFLLFSSNLTLCQDNEDSDHVPEEGKGTNRKLLIDIEKMIRENWEALKKTS